MEKGCEEVCSPCEDESYLNPWSMALIVVLILFVFYIHRMCVEHFESKREKAEYIQKNMYPLFYGGDASYSKYKEVVKDADAVEYYDLKKAYKSNQFTVDHLEKIV